jgi:DNA-binding CsgD family transcriptional regulator
MVAQSTVHYHLRKQTKESPTPKENERRRGPKPTSLVRTRDQVARMLAAGTPRAEIARSLGIRKSTVSYHARQLGAPIDDRVGRRYDWPAVRAHYADGHSIRDCMRTFGFSYSTWAQAVRRGLVTPRPRFTPVDEVFTKDSHRHRGRLKQLLLSLGLRTNTCDHCGLTEWRDKPITVALHHINGDRMDNRVENLELLWPNCHSQTDTFAGRNGRGPRAKIELLTSRAAEVTADADQDVDIAA